jgi:hypothetical protein
MLYCVYVILSDIAISMLYCVYVILSDIAISMLNCVYVILSPIGVSTRCADKYLARPTSRYILFDGENTSLMLVLLYI